MACKVMQKSTLGGTLSLLDKSVSALKPAEMHSMDDHQFSYEDSSGTGELSPICAHFVLKCLFLARIGRPDLIRTVNLLSRSHLLLEICIIPNHLQAESYAYLVTFVPISWMCKKQTAVSHSSAKSEIISLDAGLRMEGIPALQLRHCF